MSPLAPSEPAHHPPPDQAQLHRRVAEAAILSVAIFTVYLLFPIRNHYWDGVGFALQIEAAADSGDPALLHPNHLVYTLAGRLAYGAVRTVFPEVRALAVLQYLNMALAAATAGILYGLFRRHAGGPVFAGGLAALFAFSAGWWRFGADAGAYIPSVLGLVLGLAVLLRSGPPAPVRLGLAHAAAMLFHELAVGFLPAAVCGLAAREETPVRRWRAVALYLATAGGVTGAAYLAAYGRQPGGTSLWAWLTYHSPDSAFSWDLGRNLVLTVQSNVRLLVNSRPGDVFRHPDPVSLAALAAFAAALGWVIVTLIRRRAWRLPPPDPAGCLPAAALWVRVGVAWLIPYLAFLFVWLPGNTFYRLFYLPALILLLGAWLLRHGAPAAGPGRLPAVAAVLVGLFNLGFFIVPCAQVRSNPPLELAVRMQGRWSGPTTVGYGDFNPDNWTLRYFNPATRWVAVEPGNGLAGFRRLLADQQREGRTVWLDSSAVRTLDGMGPEAAAFAAALIREEVVQDRMGTRLYRLGSPPANGSGVVESVR
ncbi:MAG TPA: hypothetical protein PK017_12120 [Acidobacteriota bacterium]|nr:hypothetical protein [Acidobacteriota bacterium]